MNEENINKEYDWLIENENETFTIKTKSGDYVMEELTDEQVERATKMSQKTGVPLTKFLAVRSITEPKVTDSEFSNLKSSTTVRLKYAATKINGISDFLQ